MKSLVIKRSVLIGEHKISVCLEDPFWDSLKEITADKKTTLSGLVASIDDQKGPSNLSSAIRLFVLGQYQTRANVRGDGHGYVGQKAV